MAIKFTKFKKLICWFHSPERLWNPIAKIPLPPLIKGESQKSSTALKGLWSQRIKKIAIIILAILLLVAGYFVFLQKPETTAADWCNCEGAKVSFQNFL